MNRHEHSDHHSPHPRDLRTVSAACAADPDKTTTESGVELVKDGKLTICTHLPYEPFQFEEDGEVVGFDVDLMDLVAKELGVEQEIINTPFEGIQSGAGHQPPASATSPRPA